MTTKQRLLNIFHRLLTTFGRRNWWPGETPLEVIIGAVLTQNTAWKNVERAIRNMKQKGLIDLRRLYEIEEAALGNIIKPAGFYNLKSKRLKNIVKVLHNDFQGDLDLMSRMNVNALRTLLLTIDGIGYETADSILLYALNKPVFVVDAYTRRFLKNHRLHSGKADYQTIQAYFMRSLPTDTYLFNEFHALIVCLAQNYCKKVPLCDTCPIKGT